MAPPGFAMYNPAMAADRWVVAAAAAALGVAGALFFTRAAPPHPGRDMSQSDKDKEQKPAGKDARAPQDTKAPKDPKAGPDPSVGRDPSVGPDPTAGPDPNAKPD
jgi:hypothetical protein